MEYAYGITMETYRNMFDAQGGQCAICFTPLILMGGNMATQKVNAHIDHCHTSGVVRGLLCMQCNMMLGGAKDSVETLQNAIAYLRTLET